MKKKFLLFMVIFASVSIYGNNTLYYDFLDHVSNKLKMSCSIPKRKIVFNENDAHPNVIRFGEMLEDFKTCPTFEAGPTIRLSKDCAVLITNPDFAISTPEGKVNNASVCTEWMLNNCGLPWAQWYIDGIGGVILDGDNESTGFKKLSSSERERLKKQIEELKEQYSWKIEQQRLNNKLNCDLIHITQIPHLNKVENMLNPQQTDRLKSLYNECYAVELFNTDAHIDVIMLFFIDTEETTIEKALFKLSRDLKFN